MFKLVFNTQHLYAAGRRNDFTAMLFRVSVTTFTNYMIVCCVTFTNQKGKEEEEEGERGQF